MTKPLNIVGHRVRKLRNAKELSQAKLAEKCQLLGWDITREGIAKIEGKSRHVDDSELVYLCKVLCVKPDVLLGLGSKG